MTYAATSTFDEAVQLQPAPEITLVQRVVAIMRGCRLATSRAPSARDGYLEAAVDHADVERRLKAWDAHEEGALRRLSTGQY